MFMIKVQPARHLRVAFARWAVAQQPKVRTVSDVAFGVPAHLIHHIPEALLTGALLDSQPYIPATAAEHPPAEPEADTTLDEPLPEVEPAGAVDVLGDVHACPDCARDFDTSRGLAAHRRQAHPEEES